MKKKKLISLLLSALMVSSGSSLGVFAEEFADSETAEENYISVEAESPELPDEEKEAIKDDEEQEYDLNGDGVTDEKDAGIIQNYLLGNGELSDELLVLCDMNEDGKLNVDDAQNILIYYTETKVAGKVLAWEDLLGNQKQAQPRPRLLTLHEDSWLDPERAVPGSDA